MEPILQLSSSTGPAVGLYQAAMCSFWCFDARFGDLQQAFRARIESQYPGELVDFVMIPGGARVLALPAGDPARAGALAQIAASIQLHHARRVGLTLHLDCGGYGGSGAFPTRDAELAHHRAQLDLASATVAAAFPELEISRYIATFDGLYAV